MFTLTSPAGSGSVGPTATRSRLRRAAIATLLTGLPGLAGPRRHRRPGDRSTRHLKVDGKIKTQLAPCAAPAGLCFDGSVKGDLDGIDPR